MMDKKLDMKDQLISKKKLLQTRIEEIEEKLQRRNKPLDKDFAEQAVERENDEVLEALLLASREEIKQINVALQRLENDEYTVCASCGEDIPMARLEAIPYTDVCVECAERRQR